LVADQEPIIVRRLFAILALAFALLDGCARRPVTLPEVTGAPSGSSTAPAPTPVPSTTSLPSTAPFTNSELIDQLRKQGVGRAETAGSGAAPSGPALPPAGDAVPEIRETPRGVVITLPMAHFAFDRSDLDAEARWVVERIAYVLNLPRAHDRKVVLEGHADYIGTEAYNLALSRRRAETVARELIGRGVRRDRVAIEAYGKSRPIAPNRNPDGTDNPGGRAQNRRVEAIIHT
jgi:outer membrane protein OmpA-like peptidoglycan-associated protein